MSKKSTKAGPIGFSRSPGGSRRDARNSDTGSLGALTIASGVPDVSIGSMVYTGTAATDFATLAAKIRELETAHNRLLATLRDGQVIDGSR